jgi:putative glutathione S-transferase
MKAGSVKAEIIEGEFKRQDDVFREWVRRDGLSGFAAAPDRYHLYVSLACPWAHRTIIARRLKKLEEVIGMTVVDPLRGDDRGWTFTDGPGHSQDPINGFTFLSEAYLATDPQYNNRVTVPVLWDKQQGRVVSNSDDDILRMLNSAFDDYTDSDLDLYPEDLRAEIDAINDLVYPNVNDGVYRTGFASSQAAYDYRVQRLFDALDQLEERLAQRRYLVGDRVTEADWRLFPTLIRFDEVYYVHFKCNKRRIVDYPNLWGYLRELYQWEGVAETVNFDHIKRHYYITHDDINPTQIVPVGPDVDLLAPHGREVLAG